jgi:hypothetical protein
VTDAVVVRSRDEREGSGVLATNFSVGVPIYDVGPIVATRLTEN